MGASKQKRVEMTHVRVSTEKRETAKKIARNLSAREDRDVYMEDVIDEILDVGLKKKVKELGIK